eukprot:2814841-Rhodomonas_salina.1
MLNASEVGGGDDVLMMRGFCGRSRCVSCVWNLCVEVSMLWRGVGTDVGRVLLCGAARALVLSAMRATSALDVAELLQ